MPTILIDRMAQSNRSANVTTSGFFHLVDSIDANFNVTGRQTSALDPLIGSGPSAGERWIVVDVSDVSAYFTAGLPGTAEDNDIVEYDGSAWSLIVDVDNAKTNEGQLVYVADENLFYFYNGSAWVAITDTDTDTTYSAATTSVLGLVMLEDGTTQSVAANTVSTAAGRTYGVQFNSSNQAVVNVPWADTDTNTTYSIMGAASGSGAGDPASGLTPNTTTGDQVKFLKGDATWDVPTDTNTTYAAMGAASSGSAGDPASGLTPDTVGGDEVKFLKGNATWDVPTNTTYSIMGAASGVGAGSPASGLTPSTTSGDQVKFLKGNATWAVPTDTNTTYSVFTGAAASGDVGTTGLVPKPAEGEQGLFLRGDSTWASSSARSVSGTTDNGIITWVNSGSTFAAESNFTFSGSTLAVAGNATITGGAADTQQLTVKGHSDNDGASIFVVEDGAGTDVFEVTNTGQVLSESGAIFKGNSFLMGDTDNATNFIHATGARNLNFRNANADYFLNFDISDDNGELRFRTHNGLSGLAAVTDIKLLIDSDGDATFNYDLTVEGGTYFTPSRKAATATLSSTDRIVYMDIGAGGQIITLPQWSLGRVIEIYFGDDRVGYDLSFTVKPYVDTSGARVFDEGYGHAGDFINGIQRIDKATGSSPSKVHIVNDTTGAASPNIKMFLVTNGVVAENYLTGFSVATPVAGTTGVSEIHEITCGAYSGLGTGRGSGSPPQAIVADFFLLRDGDSSHDGKRYIWLNTGTMSDPFDYANQWQSGHVEGVAGIEVDVSTATLGGSPTAADISAAIQSAVHAATGFTAFQDAGTGSVDPSVTISRVSGTQPLGNGVRCVAIRNETSGGFAGGAMKHWVISDITGSTVST